MDMLTDKQSSDLINLFKAELARRGLSHAERLQRFSGFLTCMCHFAAIEGFQMRDIFTEYEKALSTQKPSLDDVMEWVNRCKNYLAVDRYGQDKVTILRGYLLALQHQGLIDPWTSYDIITRYEKELAND